jgi:nitrite reductase (NADH) small subunit
VLSRGIVGDRGGVPVVVSPVYKQAFELATGKCLDEPSVSIAVHQVRVRDGVVEVT